MASIVLGAVGTLVAIAINCWLSDRYKTVGAGIGGYVAFTIGALAMAIGLKVAGLCP